MRANPSWLGLRAYVTDKWFWLKASAFAAFWGVLSMLFAAPAANAQDSIPCNRTLADALLPIRNFIGGGIAAVVDDWGWVVIALLFGILVFVAASKKAKSVITFAGIAFVGYIVFYVFWRSGASLTPNVC